ncbi:uncharacterized protein BP5553_10405 [Venustampulla echinocandica]|uniref:C2H2-type domain-containing protein n=1 Tax=Venustampulla echinocandica TaxID=2656787 RepID=A0A370T973_9HELO|nr:uncharacterized protein BP5553_10405 [Venustampulla echinocandica]RDL30127.1 hypothetical protein BP5553_10405 [Venustampulla echinocandica]
MPVLAVQGFRMLCDDLSNFLIGNGLSNVFDTDMEPLRGYDDGVSADEEEEIVTVFRRKGIDCNLKIVLPWVDVDWTFDPSTWVFVCFHWVYLLSNKRIDNELDKPVPASFEHLRQVLQVQSPICQYLLNTNKSSDWNSDGLDEELNKIPTCDKCGLIFTTDNSGDSPRRARYQHMGKVHGKAGSWPLPDNI